MSRKKKAIIDLLRKRGFTDSEVEFKLFYWAKDGWYLHCDQLQHHWIGHNFNHCLEEINKGYLDKYLEN